MAGPFLNKTGVNIDEAIGAGLEASGVAPQTSVPTASTPGVPDAGNPLAPPDTQTGRGGMRGPQFQGPEWAWRPVQEDFGQVDVRRGQYDTGMVPTVNVQLPFAALANRQQATAQKRAALDKKIADFDLYAGIGKAPDPYMPAFGKLARGGMNQFVQEIADALYEGDTAQATRAIATDPELNNRWRARAAEYEELGTRGQYWFKLAQDYVEAYEADPTDKDPEDYRQAMAALQGIGEFGGPNGPSIEELSQKGRRLESVASRQALFNNMKPVLDLAMQELQEAGTISREMGNMIGLRETNVKNYDELIDRLSNDWYRSGIGESAEDNKKWLKARLGESRVTSTKLQGRNWQPEYMFNAGREVAPAQAAVGTAIQDQPMSGQVIAPGVTPYNTPVVASSSDKVTSITPQRQVGKSVQPIYKESILNENGKPIEIGMPTIKYDATKAQWVIEGRSLTDKASQSIRQLEQGANGMLTNINPVIEIITNSSERGVLEKVPASQNEAAMVRMVGFRRPQQWVAERLKPIYGELSEADIDALMADPSSRDEVNKILSQQ